MTDNILQVLDRIEAEKNVRNVTQVKPSHATRLSMCRMFTGAGASRTPGECEPRLRRFSLRHLGSRYRHD